MSITSLDFETSNPSRLSIAASGHAKPVAPIQAKGDWHYSQKASR